MADQAQAPATGGGEAPAELPEQKVVVPTPVLEAAASVPEVKPSEKETSAVSNQSEAIPHDEETTPLESAKAKEAQVTPEVKPVDAIAPVPEMKPIEPSTEAIKIESASEIKSTEVTAEIKPEEKKAAEETKPAHKSIEGDWQQREAELLKKIENLEKVKSEAGSDGLKLELKVRGEEIDILKARVKNLETELQAALSKPGAKNHEMIENIKQQHEELLSKARGMIFDKTKMVKNQELQIEALTTQVQSLKDINMITKDLLEIRNSECKAMEDRLEAMEARFKAEKERFSLVMKKTETGTALNDDLKKEYEMQLGLFKELRVKYEERVQALVSENTKLKELRAAQAEADKKK